MTLSVKKKDIRDYLVSWGWLILLFIGLSYIAWYWPISTLDAIKSTEQINFFFEAYGLNDNTLENDLLIDLQGTGVLEVNLHQYSPDDASLTSYYDSFGSLSDFLVLTKTDLDTMFASSSSTSVTSEFVPFSTALKAAVAPTSDYDYYAVGGISYGLKVYDADSSSYNLTHPFTKLLTFTSEGKTADSYYLLLNASTPNFKPYDTDATTSNGIEALRFFLEAYHA